MAPDEPPETFEDQPDLSHFFYAPLADDEKAWLQEKAKGFRLYDIASSFILAMKEENKIITPRIIEVPGPYEIDDTYAECHIEPIPSESLVYKELFELARNLTPPDKKPSCPPGSYVILSTESYILKVEEIGRHAGVEAKDDEDNGQAETNVPLDFDLVVGEGDNQRTIHTNKAVVAYFFRGVEALADDLLTADKVVLPDLDPKAVELVLKETTTRTSVEMTNRWRGGEEAEQEEEREVRFGCWNETELFSTEDFPRKDFHGSLGFR